MAKDLRGWSPSHRRYRYWYVLIINRARNRQLDGYCERHHVVPRSYYRDDGNLRKFFDYPSNVVNLTYREHFICHWLLTKFTRGKYQLRMMHALAYMTRVNNRHERIIASWQYDVARRARRGVSPWNKGKSSWSKGKKFSPEHCAKISASAKGKNKGRKLKLSPEQRAKLSAALKGNTHNKGRKLTPEQRAKLRAANKDRKVSIETRAKLSAAFKGRKRATFTPEHRAKISAALKGHKFGPPTPETRAKISASLKGKSSWNKCKSSWIKGKTHTLETRAKLSAANMGHKVSPEQRAKQSAAMKGRKRAPHSLETRAKMSAAHRARSVEIAA
jgi:hypothetical protein